jgi:hypothetical protein
MNYDNLVVDFIKRTKSNLEYVELNKNDNLFEFTQLINSLLGIVVLPRERSLKSIPNTDFETLLRNGWRLPTIYLNTYGINDLRNLIRNFRNSIAHFNLRILSNANNQIDRLEIYNKRKNRVVFEAVFTLEELRAFVDKLTKIILNEN